MNERELALLRTALLAKWRELNGHGSPFEGLHIEAEADPVDQVRAEVDRELAAEVITHESALAREVADALRKLDSSGYGRCESCEEPIHARRLEAAPWARLCFDCQARCERQEEAEQVA